MTGVTQGDREAAAALVRWQREATDRWKENQDSITHFFVADFSRAIMQGIWDHHPVVQAFAAHRIAALEEAAKVAEGLKREVPYEHNQYPCTTTMGRIATAIRNLKGAGA